MASKKIKSSEEEAKEKLLQQFDLDRFDQEEMKRDVVILTKWFYESTRKMTTDELRLFCLNFLLNSGILYITMQDMFGLPSLSLDEIKQLNLNFETGVSKDLMKYLKGQLSYWDPTTKNVNIILSEVPLKSNMVYEEATDKIIGFQDIDGVRTSDIASNAVIMAVQGTSVTFFQPLGYAFTSPKDSSDELIKWIKKTIQELEKSGFNVCSIISEQAPTFQRLVDNLGITAETPFFELDGKKVFYMFDPIYLLVAIRNSLLKTNLFYDDELVSWSDVVDVHKQYKILTEAHVNPSATEKRNGKLAAEVFDRVIMQLIEAKYAPEVCGTANFIGVISNAFQILVDVSDSFLPAFTGVTQQIMAFKDALTVSQRIRLPEENSEAKDDLLCFKGLQITLNTIMQLQKCYKKKGLKTLYMSMFNTEQLVTHHEDMQKRAKKKILTPMQFKWAFSKVMLDDLIRSPVSDSVVSCIGPMLGQAQPSGFVGQKVGEKEGKRLLDCIRSGTFEIYFKDHVLPTPKGNKTHRHIPL